MASEPVLSRHRPDSFANIELSGNSRAHIGNYYQTFISTTAAGEGVSGPESALTVSGGICGARDFCDVLQATLARAIEVTSSNSLETLTPIITELLDEVLALHRKLTAVRSLLIPMTLINVAEGALVRSDYVAVSTSITITTLDAIQRATLFVTDATADQLSRSASNPWIAERLVELKTLYGRLRWYNRIWKTQLDATKCVSNPEAARIRSEIEDCMTLALDAVELEKMLALVREELRLLAPSPSSDTRATATSELSSLVGSPDIKPASWSPEMFDFQTDLDSSAPYRRTVRDANALLDAGSSNKHTTWSDLSMVSSTNLSTIAALELPLDLLDLAYPDPYIFRLGDLGMRNPILTHLHPGRLHRPSSPLLEIIESHGVMATAPAAGEADPTRTVSDATWRLRYQMCLIRRAEEQRQRALTTTRRYDSSSDRRSEFWATSWAWEAPTEFRGPLRDPKG